MNYKSLRSNHSTFIHHFHYDLKYSTDRSLPIQLKEVVANYTSKSNTPLATLCLPDQEK